MYFTFLVLFSQCLACSMKYSEASDQLVYQGGSHQASKELLGKKQYWAPACTLNGLWMPSFRAAELRCCSLKLSHEDKWLCFSLEKMSTTHFPFIYAARACTGDSDALWFNLKCLSKKEFDPLWLFWGWSVLAASVETVSHTEKRFSFHLTKKRVKIKRPWLSLTSI